YKSLAAQGDPAELLQKSYVTDNPHPVGERKLLESSNNLLVYDLNHRPQHTEFRALLETRGYTDVFLFDVDANNVYSVQKDSDFGTRFAEGTGPWADTDLGRVVRAALAGEAGSVFLSDFAPYGPNGGAAASFIAAPVINQGMLSGVLAYQMPLGRISELLARTRGLGQSGEVYLVG